MTAKTDPGMEGRARRIFAPYGKPVRLCIVPECGRLTAYRLMVRRHGPGIYRGSDRRVCRAHSRRAERVGWAASVGPIRSYRKSAEEEGSEADGAARKGRGA